MFDVAGAAPLCRMSRENTRSRWAGQAGNWLVELIWRADSPLRLSGLRRVWRWRADNPHRCFGRVGAGCWVAGYARQGRDLRNRRASVDPDLSAPSRGPPTNEPGGRDVS